MIYEIFVVLFGFAITFISFSIGFYISNIFLSGENKGFFRKNGEFSAFFAIIFCFSVWFYLSKYVFHLRFNID